jgi:hypothetical protein
MSYNSKTAATAQRTNANNAVAFPLLAILLVGFGVLSGCSAPSQLVAQAEPNSPQAILDQLNRDAMQDLQRRRLDEQRERTRRQQEEAYDREMCLKVGYTGPDVDQCVRDSGVYRRRGSLPAGQPSEPIPPMVHCTTTDNGDGTRDTDCF